jgi:RecA-family ATPase
MAVSVYLTCEDDVDELHRRQAAICGLLGIELSELTGRLYLVTRAGCLGNELATFPDGVLKTTALWEALLSITRDVGAELIVLDNVAHFFAGNENARNEVAAFVNLTNRLAIETGAAVLLLGHPSKAHDFSGSTAWSNQFRARLYLDRPKDELDPDLRELTAPKANYSPAGTRLKFRWHKGSFVRDEDLPESHRERTAATIQASADNDVFLRCLDVRNAQLRPVSESRASRTYAPKEFVEMAESNGIGRPRLEAAMDRLFRIAEIEVGLVCRSGRKDRHGLRRKAR